MNVLHIDLAKLSQHPCPDFANEAWVSLDGEWEFAFDETDAGELEGWYISHDFPERINVPYVYQCERSGIGLKDIHDIVWYRKTVSVDDKFKGKRVILILGAVDFYSKIWINGKYAGEHTGGYSSIKLDVTDFLELGKDNAIVIRVYDESYSREQPRGKQGWLDKNFGCWYTRHTGIWQSVWMEILHPCHIQEISISTDITRKQVGLEIAFSKRLPDTELSIRIFKGELEIASIRERVLECRMGTAINLENPAFENGICYWNPESPELYELEIGLLIDGKTVDKRYSYFGMREISIEKGKILLNQIPVYQKLILYQGYSEEGLISSGSDEEILKDLNLIKAMGFNGLRIHQKVESPRFLYLCDKTGLLVWEEMPSAYRFSGKSVKVLLSEWTDIVIRDKNHPSIITWVIFNESWGVPHIYSEPREQAFAKAMLNITKALDGTRPVIDNDGWEHTETDIVTIHDYGADAEHYKSGYANKENVVNGAPSEAFPRFIYSKGHDYKGQPVIISEYGGIAFDSADGWGYNGRVQNGSEFLEHYRSLTEAIRGIDYLCGYCYTQFTDVEQEVNGLLSIGRVPKVDIEELKKINEGR